MLEAKDITVRYGSRIAVKSVSLRVQPGHVTAIIGPNGAGKSTLLRTLNGTIDASSGDVLLEGRTLKGWARRAITRHISVVAQETPLNFPVTVFQFVLSGRYAWSNAWGWETDRDVSVAGKVLAETELDDFQGRFINELSGGERQRVMLARALATEAKILLLDEPTANLDLAHQAKMLQLVRSRCDRDNTAAVVVTHELNLAAEFSDRVLLLKEGQSVGFGNPLETLTAESLTSVFGLQVLVDAHPISGAQRITPVF